MESVEAGGSHKYWLWCHDLLQGWGPLRMSFVAPSFVYWKEVVFVRCRAVTGGRTCDRKQIAQPVPNNKHSTGFRFVFN